MASALSKFLKMTSRSKKQETSEDKQNDKSKSHPFTIPDLKSSPVFYLEDLVTKYCLNYKTLSHLSILSSSKRPDGEYFLSDFSLIKKIEVDGQRGVMVAFRCTVDGVAFPISKVPGAPLPNTSYILPEAIINNYTSWFKSGYRTLTNPKDALDMFFTHDEQPVFVPENIFPDVIGDILRMCVVEVPPHLANQQTQISVTLGNDVYMTVIERRYGRDYYNPYGTDTPKDDVPVTNYKDVIAVELSKLEWRNDKVAKILIDYNVMFEVKKLDEYYLLTIKGNSGRQKVTTSIETLLQAILDAGFSRAIDGYGGWTSAKREPVNICVYYNDVKVVNFDLVTAHSQKFTKLIPA